MAPGVDLVGLAGLAVDVVLSPFVVLVVLVVVVVVSVVGGNHSRIDLLINGFYPKGSAESPCMERMGCVASERTEALPLAI